MSTRRLRPLPSRPRVTHSRPRPPPGAPPPRADRLHVPFATIHLSMFLVPTCHPTFGGLIDTNEDRKGRVRMARLRVRPLPSPQGVQTRGSRLWSCPPRQSVQTAAVGTTRPRTGFIHSCAKMVRGGACPPSGVPSSRDWPRPGRRGVGNRPGPPLAGERQHARLAPPGVKHFLEESGLRSRGHSRSRVREEPPARPASLEEARLPCRPPGQPRQRPPTGGAVGSGPLSRLPVPPDDAVARY